jgi:hypothetical protein
MLKRATAQDAEILLRLFQTTNTPQMQESMSWFMTEFSAKNYKEFSAKYPAGSAGMRHLSTVLGSFELAGVLISHGVLNEDLYFDISAIGFLWPSLEKIIPEWQKVAGPALWENAVWLAERQKRWSKEVWKPGLQWKQKTEKIETPRKGRK